MSIMNGLLRAFGFGGGNEDDEELDLSPETAVLPESAESLTQAEQPEAIETAQDSTVESAAPDSNESAGGVQDNRRQATEGNVDTKAIFDGVVEVLNSNLPPYLRQCLDNEEQCKFIYEHLDESLRGFIAGVAKAEGEKANRRWASEKRKLFKQVNEAAEQIAHATERASKAEEKALSADRQKRAMTQRNADLERRVARLQAEIEQYDLEKNSLLNKLRVAEVHNGHNSDANVHAPEADLAVAGQMAKDLEAAKTEIESLRAKLEEANKSLEVIGEIQRQMQSIEDMKKRKNARIRDLKAENAQLRAALEALQASKVAETTVPDPVTEEVAPVAEVETHVEEAAEDKREVIDMTQDPIPAPEPDATGVSAVIADDMDMLEAISESDAMSVMVDQGTAATKKKRKPRARKPKLVAIDQSISESEWLLSSSPMPQDTSMTGFGYQEPPRRNTLPDNPAQMSLW